MLPVRELREQTASGAGRRAQSVGSIPGRRRWARLLTISGQKWLCGPDSTARSSSPIRSACGRPPELLLRDRPRAVGSSSPPRVRTLRSRLALEHRPRRAPERSTSAPTGPTTAPPDGGALPGAARAGDRGRPGKSDARRLPRQIHPGSSPGWPMRGVLVREIPKTGLVRVSCGWWTDETDLQRWSGALGRSAAVRRPSCFEIG